MIINTSHQCQMPIILQVLQYTHTTPKSQSLNHRSHTFPLSRTVPTKLMGHLSLSPICCKSGTSSKRHSMASFSWYSAPQSSRVLIVGSPSWNLRVKITAPEGSTNSFNTFPAKKYCTVCRVLPAVNGFFSVQNKVLYFHFFKSYLTVISVCKITVSITQLYGFQSFKILEL